MRETIKPFLKSVIYVVLSYMVIVPPTFVWASEIPKLLVTIRGGEKTDAFNQPRAVFYEESKQRLYIADTMNNRLVSYTDTYEYKSEFNAGGRLKRPFNLLVNGEGIFIVTEKSTNKVALIDISEKKLSYLSFEESGLNPVIPFHLALDRSDNVYLIDRKTNRILVFDKDFEYIRSILVEGVTGLNDVKVDEVGNIYVLDTLEGRVYVLDQSGTVKLKFGGRGPSQEKFDFPVSLAVDSRGYIYVVDQHRSTVHIFDADGGYRASFGGLGWKEGKFYYPCYIFIDRSDTIYVVDRDNDRIQVFKK